MTKYHDLAGLVPPECAEDMRRTLGLIHLPEERSAPIRIRGVECSFERKGFAKDSRLVVLVATPTKSEDWDFGTCFPQLPGAWNTGNHAGAFHLRFLSLDESIWIYVWTRDPSPGPIEAVLAGMDTFSNWAPDNGVDLEKHGLERDDLEQIPLSPPRVTIAKANFGLTKPSWSGFFIWGSLADSLLVPPPRASDTAVKPASAAAVLSQIHDFIDTVAGDIHLIFRAKLRYDPPEDPSESTSPLFRRLLLQTSPIETNLGGGLKLSDASIFLTDPNFFSRDNTRLGIKADLLLPHDRRIHVEIDFPINGDLIRASGTYLGEPEHLLGESAAFGLPGPPAQFGSDTQIAVGLEFSKSEKTLTKLTFALDLRNKDWTLIPAPVDLELEGVAVHVTVYDPLIKSSRQVRAQMAVGASFGTGAERIRLLGGGSYPEGDIYLQSGNSLKVGTLLEKLVGPSPGLEKFTIDDLRLDYNYRSRQMGLSFDVPNSWEIVEGFEIGALQFRVQGRTKYGGGISAQLKLDVGADTPLQIMLSGLYDGGWQFEGTTGPGQEIPLGNMFGALAKKFDPGVSAPASLDDALNVSNLAVSFNSVTRAFDFRCRVEMDIEDRKVDLDLSIAIDHHEDPKNKGKTLAETRLEGVIRFDVPPKSYEFDVIFDREEIELATEEKVTISTLLASFNSTAGEPPSMKDLVPKAYEGFVPDIKTKGVFLAKQWRKNADKSEASKWLIGLSLQAGLDLSNVKLPNLPLVGSGGPPKSLKLDLQLLLPMPSDSPFDKDEMGIMGKLNSSGAVSIPDEVPGIVVATVLTLDGKTIKLNLPIAANPKHKEGEAPFLKDTAPPPPTVPIPNVAAGADTTKWITIQRSFGPIHIDRIGLKYANERLYVTFDAGLTAAGFTISLQGLGIDTPLTEFDPHFHITGIGLDYASGGIEIGAAFLKEEMIDPAEPEQTYTAYAGQAILKTPSLTLSALGSFAKYHGESSLFIYAMLDYPLGGPSFFFVNGLAAGFGYNRRAIIPPISQVHTYPLVTKAIAGPVQRDDKGTPIKTDLATELGRMEAFLPPDTGSLFFAVGIKFSSFELIDSFALLIAQFGHETQFDVLGVSVLQVPAKATGGGGTPLAEIHMNWHGYLRPEEGAIGLTAELATGSFVFSRNCHLTGGFAYASWFSGEHGGDFVYTLGGYHPDYQKPDHYPNVPRLGFNWVLPAANLTLKGELYYALTAHAFMAGGLLDASIHGGFDIGIAGVDFHAHLHMAADCLITWEPYHYDAEASLDLDIGITAHLLFFSKSFSLNIGGDMHIWGPDFAGEAHLHLKIWIISPVSYTHLTLPTIYSV